jgi:[ribosomal protein S5]-alanine N-acetyltransferase
MSAPSTRSLPHAEDHVRRTKGKVLSGPRVVLRPLEGSDFEAWRAVRIRSRDWLEPWEPMAEPGAPDPVTDAEAFRARCGAWERQRHFDTAYGFGMFLRDGTFIGEVSLGSLQRGPFQSAFVGYWVDAAHAGQGLVPEGVAVILRYGFEDLGLHRIEAAIVPRNTPSRRVVEKLGMREEGLAERFLQIRGVWEDHVRFAMTAEEWEKRRDDIAGTFLTESTAIT